jgi:hypothetical protein
MLALALAAMMPNPATAQERVSNDQAGAAIAAIIALGIGVAIARHGNDHDLNSDWDADTYGAPFSPSPNVVCLPEPRQCFEQSHYSARWTRRIFGS